MGNSTSRVVGCFVQSSNAKDGVSLEFLEPLDEGLGHSFCYVRPEIIDSPAVTPSNSERFTVDSSTFDLETYSGSFRQAIVDDLVNSQRPTKNFSETTFKTISGASVSANVSTARTGNMSMLTSGDLQEPAATFESTSSFAAIPLQPVPRGSGPLNGLMSGPLERGFVSGPLERGMGFMSGPLEKGAFMSGPIDANDRSNFSAPLGYGQRKAALGRLMRSMSRPMKTALSRTLTRRLPGPGWIHRLLLQPMTKFVWNSKEAKFQPEAPQNNMEVGSSQPEYSNTRNLQWAHGKAGEDRFHFVLSEEQGWLFVGIYDGFSGPDAPDFLMGNLYKEIDKELKGLLWDDQDKLEADVPVFSQCDEIGSSSIFLDETVTTQLSSDDQEHKCLYSSHFDDCLVKKCSEGIRNNQSQEEGKDKVPRDEPEKIDVVAEKVGEITVELEQDQGNRDVDTEHGGMMLSEISKMPRTRSKKSKRLYELFQIESVEGSCEKSSQLAPELWSVIMSTQGLPWTVGEDLCFGEGLAASGCGSCSKSNKCGGSISADEIGSLRGNEGLAGADSLDPSIIPVSSSSVSEVKQLMKSSLFGSRLRRMYRKQKSLRKKLFPWSYDWHRDLPPNAERMITPSVVIRRCKSELIDHEAVLRAMERALQTTEEAYMDMVEKALDKNPELALMGSCVLVMLMKDQDVYVMNLGDSRVILGQDRLNERRANLSVSRDDVSQRSRSRESLVRVELDRISEESPMNNINSHVSDVKKKNNEISICKLKMRAVQLSTDHSTSVEEEVARIKAEHPDDVQAVLNDRVKGHLKVTRAFGAAFLKNPKFNEALLEMFRIDYIGTSPYISCIPSILHHHLCSSDRFLVLSSDGLYQYFHNEEVVSLVAWFMEKAPEGDPAQYLISELLFRAAKKNGMDFHELLDIPQGDRRKYHDDVSVMVISLEGRIWRSSG